MRFPFCQLQNKISQKAKFHEWFNCERYWAYFKRGIICSTLRTTAVEWSSGEVRPSPSPPPSRRGREKEWSALRARRWNEGSAWGRDGSSEEAEWHLHGKNTSNVINQFFSSIRRLCSSRVKSYRAAWKPWPCSTSLPDEGLVENYYTNRQNNKI